MDVRMLLLITALLQKAYTGVIAKEAQFAASFPSARYIYCLFLFRELGSFQLLMKFINLALQVNKL